MIKSIYGEVPLYTECVTIDVLANDDDNDGDSEPDQLIVVPWFNQKWSIQR